MKKLLTTISAAFIAALIAGGCGTQLLPADNKELPTANPPRQVKFDEAFKIIGGESNGASAVVPNAVIYRTNGDYRDKVPVQLAPGNKLLSYPAPSDINPEVLPVVLADGFLLDRRGITINSVFTRYTYAEYASLAATPPTDSLLAAIIPGSCVVELASLPMTTAEALADTAAINAIIRGNY